MIERTPLKILDQYRGKAFTGQWPTLPELFRMTASRYPDSPCFTVRITSYNVCYTKLLRKSLERA